MLPSFKQWRPEASALVVFLPSVSCLLSHPMFDSDLSFAGIKAEQISHTHPFCLFVLQVKGITF